jgi:membrane fusion protein, multidrug efflux system
MPFAQIPFSLSCARPIAAFVAVQSLFLVLTACSGKSTPPPATPPALPVTVLEMQPKNLPAAIELMAQTEGAKETEVRARVGGILMKRLYLEGAPVKAGQPLFQIDRAPYEIALAEARAKADQTTREEARLKGLLTHQAVSQKEYDDAASANAVAQSTLHQAQLNLSWTTVTAPVAGVSGRSAKSEGNLINTSDANALTSIFQTNPMWVRFGLAESDTAKLPGAQLKAGMVSGVELIQADGSVYAQPGKINFLASTIDITLGTQQLRAEFDNKEGKLLPGQFVRVRLLTGERKGVFLVPQAAVVQTDQARLVMVADADNKVAPRPVETAEWRGKDWVVTKGLQPGDKVIVDNLMKLRPGAPVAPHPPQAAPGAPGAAPAQPAAAAKTAEAPRQTSGADAAKPSAQPAAQGKQ